MPTKRTKLLTPRDLQIKHSTKYQGGYFTTKEEEAAMTWALKNLLSIMPTIKKSRWEVKLQSFRVHQNE